MPRMEPIPYFYAFLEDNFATHGGHILKYEAPTSSVQVWSVHMHVSVKGFKMITLHSNFLQHFTKKKNLKLAVLYWIWK